MIVDGFRASLQHYCKSIEAEEVDAALLASMDRKLCDVANHIAFCHRLYAEKRAEAGSLLALLLFRKAGLEREAERADRMLSETLEIQDQLVALRASVLLRLLEPGRLGSGWNDFGWQGVGQRDWVAESVEESEAVGRSDSVSG